MNIANIITLGRVFSIPIFIYFLITGNFLVAGVIFIIASISDFVDGYVARKYNLVTNFGKFMDPTADKLLVFSALLIFVDIGFMSSIMVIIIISREFMILTMRIIAIEKGIVIPAMWSGKVKTTIQMIGIILILAFAEFLPNAQFVGLNYDIINIISLIITLVTIYSGVDYIIKSKEVFYEN